jgi:hypothetical protein
MATTKTKTTTKTTTTTTVDDDDNLVWYFSYGSNMNPEVFEKKRKIRCRDYRVCYVPGYVLTYSEGIVPYLEPAFCTCVKREVLDSEHKHKPLPQRPDIHGVAFLITRQQYEHMLTTEGGWGYQSFRNHPIWNVGHYGEEEIECIEVLPEPDTTNNTNNTKNTPNEQSTSTTTSTTVQSSTIPRKHQNGRRFKALTLVGLLGLDNPNRKPYDCNASQRYYDLVNVGARSSGLPCSYRSYLQTQHPAFSEKTGRAVGFAKFVFWGWSVPPILVETFGIYYSLFWNERRKAPTDPVVRPPWVLMKLCYLYRTFVLGYVLQTILFDWLKIPDGFKNDAVAVVCGRDTNGDPKQEKAD